MTSEHTLRAYRSDWRDFAHWCDSRGFRPLPADPETVALYVAALDQTGRRATTIRRRLAAIASRHINSGLASPTRHPAVRDALDAVEQAQALDASLRRKTPLLPSELRRLVRLLPPTLSGLRDRALLLVGQAGRLRRSELVALDVGDVAFDPGGMAIHRAGERVVTRSVERDACPVAATEDWLDAADIRAGPLFRPIDRFGRVGDGRLSDRSVALIVKRAVEAAGLDPARYAASSLRSGAAIGALLGREVDQ
jgi:site-specific recombinase XerD